MAAPASRPRRAAHLFDKFYRVGRRGEGSRRGLGIGLSVVRGMVEAMGGSVRAETSELGGLAVRLVLPTAPAPPLDRNRAAAPAASGATAAPGHDRRARRRRAHLLLVEDDEPTRRAVAANLEAHGYRVVEAGRSPSPATLGRRAGPTSILLDLGLPDRDGLDRHPPRPARRHDADPRSSRRGPRSATRWPPWRPARTTT